MSQETQLQPNETVELQEVNILDKVISATKQTAPDRAENLLRTLTDQALKGTVVYDRNLTVTLNKAIAAIDTVISTQLAAIMHAPKFTKLEGTWRGLHYLVKNSETSANLKIRVLNATKRDLSRDLDKATEFDQSLLFKSIYEDEFGTPGGEPMGAIVGDYEFDNSFEDVQLLQGISAISAASFAPFIAAASPQMLGFEDFRDLARPRDLEKIFDTVEYTKWRSFRESEDSRFVTLALPRVLARMPYGPDTVRIDEFGYDEIGDTDRRQLPHDHYCWMNAAYVMGTKLTEAFARSGWCTAIRGAENGGKVENLPTHVFASDDGDMDLKCPTEVGITDRREAELGKLGFLPLSHYKNTDYAVFFGAQTVHKPKIYDLPSATANAAISARLPYIMATSRFAHYLKVMGRDKIGSFMEADDVENWLNRWISNYVNANEEAGEEARAAYPLREARVEVREIPGRPGSYNAIAHMRPWLQLEELTTSLRMVARIPTKS
ncbi:type VI secretion system contractile sheath large subunit [Jiella sp. MQZ9-1]|uniref:Type VI secretion system contractile sheath large subunit n=1 Tax=Jiella flava TaxID=2816857 RepID=A0A939JVN7_9HYPH|nr:type VI secretion system contractile sheath large subunit [Jiella flava]MBO0662659.1 type VI secretion system contractile sheath large subunit [Jiella flava]MCD2471081.1 type VI secretion system contractile sheath large subunit [Jiella flava]